MKNMFESSEVFEKYTQIDYLYYCLTLIQDDIEKDFKRSLIEKKIDEITGWEEDLTKERINQAIETVEEIIKLKKEIECEEDEIKVSEGTLESFKNLLVEWTSKS